MFESLSERPSSVFEKLQTPERKGARNFSFAAQAPTFITKENG